VSGLVREAPATDWRVTLKRRTAVAVAALGLWAVGIEARLAYLQTALRPELEARAERQHKRTITAPAKRGDIVDRHGRVLATSADADSIYAVPSEFDDPQSAVSTLCAALGDCTPRERQRLIERFGSQRAFAYVRRQVSPDEARRVAALNLDGIGFLKESRRFYPNKELAAHLLGYVGLDNSGLGGIEAAYDSQIRGKPGTILVNTDARRHVFSRFERPPTAGSSIELTIDQYLQHIAERELHAGVIENRAAGGSVIIMDPHSGEILAMANEPTFNPNVFGAFSDVERRNRAVQDLYEPGSTFKLITASAAIDEKVVPLDTVIDTSPGLIRIGSNVIHDTVNHGVLSFSDVIADSSNVGAVKVGFQVGVDRLSRFIDRYGFGRPVSPDFPGESPGIVWDAAKWTELALAEVSIGYQVAVTPLQMVGAVSAIANGGEYVQPRVVRAVYRDNRRYVVKPKVVGRAVTPDTAATLTGIMEGVVDHGTARAARIHGYTIAGKTGTAAKLVNGHYSKSDYNASFVGFAPSTKPAVAIIVVLDSPRAKGYYGGVVSAPIFQRIAEASLRYLGVPPTINPSPAVLVARKTADPAAAEGVADRRPVVSVLAGGDPAAIPDLRGLSARGATRMLARLGLSVRMSGDGFVVAQNPLPGTPFENGDVCQLELSRVPPRAAPETAQP
jgi:cell division protein FtsI (penicillin-binding protein 3)